MSQGLSKYLAGNVLRTCNGTRQRQSAQETGAVREQHCARSWEGQAAGQEDRKRITAGLKVKRFLANLCCYECKKQQVHKPGRDYTALLRRPPWLWKPEAWCLCNCLSKIAVSHQVIPTVRGCVVCELCAGIIPRKNERETKKRLCRHKNKEERIHLLDLGYLLKPAAGAEFVPC